MERHRPTFKGKQTRQQLMTRRALLEDLIKAALVGAAGSALGGCVTLEEKLLPLVQSHFRDMDDAELAMVLQRIEDQVFAEFGQRPDFSGLMFGVRFGGPQGDRLFERGDRVAGQRRRPIARRLDHGPHPPPHRLGGPPIFGSPARLSWPQQRNPYFAVEFFSQGLRNFPVEAVSALNYTPRRIDF